MKKIIILSLTIFIIACAKKPDSYDPLNIYITWGAHDQLSDTVKLSEKLAMQELDVFLNLRKQGVKLDYFLLDMHWFDKNTLYKSFNSSWENGHKAFFEKARKNYVPLGLWLSANVLGWNENIRWLNYQDTLSPSICTGNLWMAMYEGNWTKYFDSVLEYWYNEGVTLFKIDFAAFWAAREGDDKKYTSDRIRKMNEDAFYDLISSFRKRHPDCTFIAYNGFLEKDSAGKIYPEKWTTIFKSIFCGDPQPGLVPSFSFIHSISLYSDQRFWDFQKMGIAPDKTDNAQFMISKTGTGHYLGKQEWKTMLISSLVKHCIVQTYYGNIDLLNSDDAKWMAKAQDLFFGMDTVILSDSEPTSRKPFYYHLKNKEGGLVFLVNPGQKVENIALPEEVGQKPVNILFEQKGLKNEIKNALINLAPEQSVLIGYEKYADNKFSLGIDTSTVVPMSIEAVQVKNLNNLPRKVQFSLSRPKKGNLRLVFQLQDSVGEPLKIFGGPSPNGKFMGNVLEIKALKNEVVLPVKVNYNLQIWAGLSWAVGEIDAEQLKNVTGDIDIVFSVNDSKFKGSINTACYNTIYNNF